MNEKDLLKMEFGDCKSDNFGNKYTRTVGGWVFSNFAGRLLFIPEVTGFEKSVVKKDLTTETPIRKSRTTK